MRKILNMTSLYPNKENSVRGVFEKKQVEELKNRYQVKICATVISKLNSYGRFHNAFQ